VQQRQQIKEQLGVLEERLEQLGALICANEQQSIRAPAQILFGSDILLQEALDSMRSLGQLVHDQQLFKSVSANDFLPRIISLLVQDAANQGCEVAISHFGEGKISMEMAELVMGAIVAGFRACLRSHKGFNRAERVRHHLFPIGSIYVEVRSTPSEILFRLVDDGKGFHGSGEEFSISTEKQFDKLREHIARCGGWFSRSSYGDFGGAIEFKVPLAHSRIESLILSVGRLEVLIPSSCVAEIIERGSSTAKPAQGARIFRLCEDHGVEAGDADAGVLLRVGVADFQFWLACDALKGKALVRRAPAGNLVDATSWLQNFGLFHEDDAGRALPLLEGTTLIRFYKEFTGVHS